MTIDFEKDQEEVLERTENISKLADKVKELQGIPLSKTNPEDVDTHAQDHAYDALRYLIMSRPRMTNPIQDMLRLKERKFMASDSTFGY